MKLVKAIRFLPNKINSLQKVTIRIGKSFKHVSLESLRQLISVAENKINLDFSKVDTTIVVDHFINK